MRHRLAALGLFAVLVLLPALPAAPAPKTPKRPEIYALVYLGIGRNHPSNAERIKAPLRLLPNSGYLVFYVPELCSLPLVQEREKALGREELDKWVARNLRVTNPEGTAILRLEFTDGTPQDQVVIVNAFARTLVESFKRICLKAAPIQRKHEERFRQRHQQAGIEITEEDERKFKEQREIISHPPLLLEEASLPEKQ